MSMEANTATSGGPPLVIQFSSMTVAPFIWFPNVGELQLDAPHLVSSFIYITNNSQSPAPSTSFLNLPALTSSHYIGWVGPLASVNADSLPAMTLGTSVSCQRPLAIGQTECALEIVTKGSTATNVSFKGLKNVMGSVHLGGLSQQSTVSFDSLENVQDFELDGSALSTISLPKLQAGQVMLGGYANVPMSSFPQGTVCAPIGVNVPPNPNLIQLIAPLYASGKLQIGKDPAFPKCRADALAAQLGQMPAQVYGCEVLASAPCP